MNSSNSFNFITKRSVKRVARLAGAPALSLGICRWHMSKRTRNGVVREENIF